jgi:hypothetical protein
MLWHFDDYNMLRAVASEMSLPSPSFNIFLILDSQCVEEGMEM